MSNSLCRSLSIEWRTITDGDSSTNQRTLLFFALAAYLWTSASFANSAEYVIHISVDGLNARLLQQLVDAGKTPTFKRLQDEGAWTSNARTDFAQTNTLPNHACMLTGRPSTTPEGMPDSIAHGWTVNDLPNRRATLHDATATKPRRYVPSVFDVVHDAGLSTALFVTKDKFQLFAQSYDSANGAAHANGRDKVDAFVYANDGAPQYSATMNARLLAEMAKNHYRYAFVHYRDPDAAGHATGWGGGEWRQAVQYVDGYLAEILHLIENNENLANRTVIIVNADHGGINLGHGDSTLADDFRIPLIAWGPNVSHGDLYEMNFKVRSDPEDSRPDYNCAVQPIRNGDTGNLALKLLGLKAIPGSLINGAQDLQVSPFRE